jgi:hypothetical protein
MTRARLAAVALAIAIAVALIPMAAGKVSFSAVANSSVVHTPPPAPTSVSAESGSTHSGTGTLTVMHAAGSSTYSITRYDATCTSSNGGATKRGAHNGPTAAPITVSGVTTKKTYRCSVTATNAQGASGPSAKSNAVIVGAPGRPHAPSVTRLGPGHLKVSFAAPASNGAPITSFKAVCRSSNGGVPRGKSGGASPLGVRDLTIGKTYTCTVEATNSRGTGPTSESSGGVNARHVIGAPRVCSPGARTAADGAATCAAEIAVFRSGAWLTPDGPPTSLGLAGDIPVPGHYNGGDASVRAVYRPSVGGWYINGRAPEFLGRAGDIPVPGDYNGDGTTDPAVYRPSDGGWYINGQPTAFLGTAGDIPVPADYNGDGTTDIAVFRPSTGAWYIEGQPTVLLGTNGDIPVPADYNGDGTTDAAVFRPSVGGWYINGEPTVFFGLAGDRPVPLRPGT